MPVTIPGPGAALTDASGKPTEDWYPILRFMADLANASSADIEDGDTGLATKAAKTQPEGVPLSIKYADDGDYSFFWPYDNCTSFITDTQCSTGTCTATFKKNGVAFDGTPNAVSTSIAHETHSAIELETGDLVTITLSAASACEDLSVLIRCTRTLA